jgi:hypothetical protein
MGGIIVSFQQPPGEPYQQQDHQQGQQTGGGETQAALQYPPDYAGPQPAYSAQAAQPAIPGQRGAQQMTGKRYELRGAEAFWYILGCISMGAAYFSKLPGKKAACEVFSELQLDGQGPSNGYALHGMENFWYVLMCLSFGAGYFAKVSAKKALWELVSMVQAAPGEYAGALGRALSAHAPATHR